MAALPQTYYTAYFRGGSAPAADGDWRWKFDISLDSQSIQNNSSRIKIVGTIEFKNQPNGASSRPWLIWYRFPSGSGTTYFGTHVEYGPPAGNSSRVINTVYTTWNHSSNGAGSFTIQCSGGYNYYDHNYNGVQTSVSPLITLPSIPRYANITNFAVSNDGISAIKYICSVDSSIDAIQYSLNGGGWIDSNYPSQSIGGLEPGKQYGLDIRVKRSDSQLWSYSKDIYGTKYATTTDKNKVTSTTINVNCDSPLVVTASNASGYQCDIYLELVKSDYSGILGSSQRHANTTNTTFTVEEIQSLANLIPNDNSANFRIVAVTVINGVDKYWDWKDGKYTIVNANPIFNNFTYEDINTTTKNLTGNNKTIIKDYSNLRAIISNANKAVAQKGATMTSYQLVVGAKQKPVDYSSNTDVNIDINAIDNNVFTIYAIDSRKNSTPKQLSPVNYINYFKPILSNAYAERTGGVGDETTLYFEGSFFNENFGSKVNDITISYKYKKTSEDETKWVDGITKITPIKNGNNFTFSGKIAGDKGDNGALGFDANNSYDIIVIDTDKLDSSSFRFILGSGKPNLAIHKNGVAVNMPYDEVEGGPLQLLGKNILNLLFPIGRGFIDTTDTDYSNYLGFTWQKFSIGRVPVGKDTTQMEFNPIGKTGGEKSVTLDMNMIPRHNHENNSDYGSGKRVGIWNVVSTGEGISLTLSGTAQRYPIGNIDYQGGGQPHNNLQPYEVVNYWKRIA